MIVIGVTGGIGSGKSTVSGMLAELGAVILNADIVGHEAYLPHQNVWEQVVEAFGKDILNERDEVVRSKLGEKVFGHPEELRRLNAIVHPWMYKRMVGLLDDLRAKGTRVAVLEAALLFEAGWEPLVDQVWVTDADEEQVISRLQQRNGMSEQQVRDRIKAQMPTAERVRRGDVIIDANGTLEDMKTQVARLWDEKLAAVAKG